MNAPRALPTWSGPVGLADTNSTLTERGARSRPRGPTPSGSARIAAIVASSACVAQAQVQEPGRRDLRRRDRRRVGIARGFGVQLGRERRRDRQRRHPVRTGELHRQVAGEVAVLRVGRALDLDRGPRGIVGDRRQRARGDRALPGALDRSPSLVADSQGGGRRFGVASGTGRILASISRRPGMVTAQVPSGRRYRSAHIKEPGAPGARLARCFIG